MSFIVSRFHDNSGLRSTLELAVTNPNSILFDQPTQIKQNTDTRENELHSETFVVGRLATLIPGILGGATTIRCKTFVSLGKVDLDTLKIFATNIIFVNNVHTTGDIEFYAKETFASVGCLFTGPGDMKVKSNKIWFTKPILNHYNEYVEVKAPIEENGVMQERIIKRIKTGEWHEDPIDASIRDIRIELDKQDAWDLNEYTKEVVRSMKLRPVLI